MSTGRPCKLQVDSPPAQPQTSNLTHLAPACKRERERERDRERERERERKRVRERGEMSERERE